MSDYAFIGCNLPNGLKVITVDPHVTLNGARAENAVGGFGFTRVDASFAAEWLGPKGAGSAMDIAKIGGLFAAASIEDARDMARERSGEPVAFARLDPEAPAPGIEPTDQMKAELAKVDPDKPRGPGRGRGRQPAPDPDAGL